MSCPICQSEPDQKYRPFCSRRCADIDLSQWMNGAYSVPVAEADEFSEALEEDRPERRN